MLNCTDLACVLHHHHFYAHLHHLKHHLQDDNYNSPLVDGSDIENNDNTQPISNETDSELSSLSHVDAPNEVIYMVCGVIIAMILVGVIIILVAVTINKLRKRDESSIAPPVAAEAALQGSLVQSRSNSAPNTSDRQRQEHHVVIATTSLSECNVTSNNMAANNNNKINYNNNSTDQEHVTFTRTSGIGVTSNAATNGWVFPPKAPTPNIYSCLNNDAVNDRNGFKGFRKQFSGRFKRLVAKKPEPAPAIPPELKPQLKTIYVY